MGGSASTVKVPIPDFVWLTEVPFIRIADKTTAEVCLTVNATCCARLLLTQDGGEDKLATDFLLQENTEKTITLQGLKPG
ncbi:hypothetical protein EMWEY_00027430 [Eimeria maxima]|uniref:Uncharacterized protein n=1 Tax=Eimeria maxima TaxID=5804 RepID=U6MAM1_EIMMA|nr:hypothetical protein EMWEY_00027430 [Eimeria maxima]CDJ60093.1 hypothetical protein EMWEY_00027430 [Eimeria maxima]